MTLGFSTKFKDGTETRFVEKIWSGVGKGEFLMKTTLYKPDFSKEYHPKIHSFREDPGAKRWRGGMTINCVLFNRTKNRYEFATLVCTAIQEIEIEWNAPFLKANVYIDKRKLNTEEILELVRNDGFDTLDQFHEFFEGDFYGRIIHWTDKRY